MRSALDGVSAQRALGLCVVALATTLPPAFAGAAAAAITVVAASVAVADAVPHADDRGARRAAVAVLYRSPATASRATRAQPIAVCLSATFVVLALAHPVPSGSEAGVLTVLLAALAPASAFAGIAQRARAEASSYDAARQAAAGDLLEHAARGERARIARELHDVVAHHISMIAVQAETARVSTPGHAGRRRAAARRRSATPPGPRSTEMRRLLGVLREDAGADTPELRPQPGLEQLNELLDAPATRPVSAGSPDPQRRAGRARPRRRARRVPDRPGGAHERPPARARRRRRRRAALRETAR